MLDLPADPPLPETPALEVLSAFSGTSTASDGSLFLSQLLFYPAPRTTHTGEGVGGHADQDGVITIGEWLRYSEQEVPRLFQEPIPASRNRAGEALRFDKSRTRLSPSLATLALSRRISVVANFRKERCWPVAI